MCSLRLTNSGAIAQDSMLPRPPLSPCLGDKGLPAKTLAESSDGVCLARDVGDVGADFLQHTLLAVHRAAPPAHVLGGLLDLLFPGQAEQAHHPMLFEHKGNGLYERRFVGDLPFPPPSGGCQGRQLCLRMV